MKIAAHDQAAVAQLGKCQQALHWMKGRKPLISSIPSSETHPQGSRSAGVS